MHEQKTSRRTVTLNNPSAASPEQQADLKEVDPEKMKKLFAHESTFTLIKKFFVYKLMGSDLFINNSVLGMRLAYKYLGKRATNFLVENSVGELFSGGVSYESLRVVNDRFANKNIGNVTGFVVEGQR